VTDDQDDWLPEWLDARRFHLQAVACRMIGSVGDANDAVREAWRRVSAAPTPTAKALTPTVDRRPSTLVEFNAR
jgi:RNA polymerase sigma-70 factor (ECF subfamily)